MSRINTSCGQCLYFSSFQLSVLGRNLLIFSSRPEGYSIWRRLAVSVVYFLLGVRHPMSSAIFLSVPILFLLLFAEFFFLLFVCVAVCLFVCFCFPHGGSITCRLVILSTSVERRQEEGIGWKVCLFYFALLLRQ